MAAVDLHRVYKYGNLSVSPWCVDLVPLRSVVRGCLVSLARRCGLHLTALYGAVGTLNINRGINSRRAAPPSLGCVQALLLRKYTPPLCVLVASLYLKLYLRATVHMRRNPKRFTQNAHLHV